MPDFRQQIHEHFSAQQLPAAKVDAILAAGRGVGESGASGEEKVVRFDDGRRRARWSLGLSLAAAVVLFAGLLFWWPRPVAPVSFAVLAPRVVEFFGTPPELPKRSHDPAELRAWLIAQGAPEDLRIPEKLQVLQSLGCQVVDVHGRPAYLACFWRPGKEGTAATELMHLWTVRRSDFRDAPADGARSVRELSGWSFVSWSDGDLTYTLAATAPPDSLLPFVNARRESAPRVAVMVATWREAAGRP